jgi:hypothetical protein
MQRSYKTISTRFLWVILFSLFASGRALSQEGARLEGVLLERGTRKPLSGLNVFVLPHNLKSTTAPDGSFSIEAIPQGASEIVVNAAGYERLDLKIELKAGEIFKKRLYLEKIRYEGAFETTIVGKKDKRDESRRSFTQEQFLNLPGAGGDAIKAVQNLPGINRSAGFNSNIVIQGSEPQATNYLIDGHEVPLIFHFGGLSTVVFSEAIESVDYLSAGYGPEYGRALGGLVGVKIRSPRRDRWHGLAFVDLINAGLLFEGPLSQKSGLLFSIRQSYIGDLLGAVVGDSDTFNFTVAPRYTDLTGLYDLSISDASRFRVTTIGSLDEVKFLLKKPVNNDPKSRGNFENSTQFFRVIPQLETRYSESTESRFSVGIGWTKFDIETDQNFLSVETWTLTPKAELQTKLTPDWLVYLGTDNQISFADVALLLPNVYQAGGIGNPFSSGDDLSVNVARTLIESGLYLRPVFHPDGSAWTFSPGLRGDYFNSTDEAFIDPRLALSYDVDASLRLKSSGGRYHQAPEPRESSPEVGNENLSAPEAWHLALSAEKDFRNGSSEGWSTSVGGFFRWFDDLVIRSNNQIVVNGVIKPEFFNNSGSGTAFGGETSLQYRAQPWDAMLAYTLLNSQRNEPAIGEYPAQFDQTHNINVIAGWNLANNWRISTRVRYVTGNPVTPVIGATYDADNNVFIPQRGGYYSERLDPFFQWDLRFDKKWIYDTWILSLYLDIQNVSNQANTEQIQYSYDFTQSESVSGLPVIPSLGLKGEF